MLLRSPSLRNLINNRRSQVSLPYNQTLRHKSIKTPDHLTEEQALDHAREWRTKFTPNTIDRRKASITTSRSSGPGGQHVNTTSSKITIRYPLSALLVQTPTLVHEGLENSRYCKKDGMGSGLEGWVIQVDQFRKQAMNEEEGWSRLFEEIKLIADKVIPGVTAKGKRMRVEELQEKSNIARIKMKKMHSCKKAARRNRGDH